MIDIPSLPSLLSSLGLVQPVSSVSSAVNILANISPNLTNLMAGTLLSGTVSSKDINGNTRIETPNGTLTVRSIIPMQPGDQVQFKISHTGAHFAAQLVALNHSPITRDRLEQLLIKNHPTLTQGNAKAQLQSLLSAPLDELLTFPLQGKAPQTSSQQSPLTSSQAAATQTDVHPLTPGNVIKSTLITPETAPLAKLLLGALQAKEIPSLKTILTSPLQEELPLMPATYGKTAPAPLSNNMIENAAPSGSTVTFRIINGFIPFSPGPSGTTITPPSNPDAKATASLTGTLPLTSSTPLSASENIVSRPSLQIQAQVIGVEKSGEMVISTPIGTFKLPNTVSLPKDTVLTMELLSIAAPNPAAKSNTLLNSNDVAMQFVSQWPALQALFSDAKKSSSAAESLLKNIFPSITDNAKPLAASLQQFMMAVEGGDAESWLGADTVKMLKETGQEKALAALQDDFNNLKGLFKEPSQVGEWKALFFPVYDGAELHQTRLFVRDNAPEKEKKSGKPTSRDTRFIIELDSTSFGPLQLDGLVHKSLANKHFDLVIRSTRPFPPEMQLEISRIFVEASEITGMKGGLLFQITSEFPIHPMDDILSQKPGSIIA